MAAEPEEVVESNPVNLGMFNRPRRPVLTAADVIAIALSVVWILLCGLFFLFAGQSDGSALDRVTAVVAVLALLLPIALIWVAAMAARSATIVRNESLRMQAALDAIRQSQVTQRQTERLQVRPAQPAPSPPLLETQSAPATFSSGRDTKRNEDPQGALALEPRNAKPTVPLTSEEFIRALNFPKSLDDKVGFKALRRALKDPFTNRLVQSSQDVLTLLSQEGIYMDDLHPDRARPEIWRKFAQGERGRAIAMLGGVRDRAGLSVTATRMRSDHIFRDAAHHFLRQFDQTFAAFEPYASDAEIAAVADTRTARAFMLIGRVAGTFD